MSAVDRMSDAPRARIALAGTALVALVALVAGGCLRDTDRQIAQRILDRYRRVTGAKPLPAAHVVRLRLYPESGGLESGTTEIRWEPMRYRERTSSAGVATERGLQAGRAYYTDEDGVTRVVSEPVVRELLTRSYFWRRAWLFADLERARSTLGPAEGGNVSVRLTAKGGNPLLLEFSADGRLRSARSPGFRYDFASPTAFRESSGRRPTVRAEISWVGLPTGPIPDAAVGGGGCRFAAGAPPIPFERDPDGRIVFPARVGGVAVRLALDSAADGPLAVSATIASRVSLSFVRDVYGRRIAPAGRLEADGVSCAGIHVVALPGAAGDTDGIAGATLFREAVVGVDAGAGRVSFHDPAAFVAPAGFTRVLVDDDGNRPVARIQRRGESARLLVGSATGAADLRLAPDAAKRMGIDLPGRAHGLHWGPAELPEAAADAESRDARADWGDDGTLGNSLLLRYRVYLDMPHRWAYLRAR